MSQLVAYWYLCEDKDYYKMLWSEKQQDSNYFLTPNRDTHSFSVEISIRMITSYRDFISFHTYRSKI